MTIDKYEVLNMAAKAGISDAIAPLPALFEFASLVEAAAKAKERGAILRMSQEQWFKTQADYDAAILTRGQA